MGNTGMRLDLRYIIGQLGHVVKGNLRLRGDNGLNIWRQAVRPQSAEKLGCY